MKALQIPRLLTSASDLTVTNLPDPVPNADEYLISVTACALNFFDLLQIRGKYQHQPPLPFIAGSEFSGTVVSGPRGGKYPPGTRVFGATQGAFATKVRAKEHALLPVPAGWSPAEAAGLYVTAPTGYAALKLRAGLKRGETVLVHAAAGGVGLAAVQIAKALGARVIAAAGTEEKRRIAREFGADEVVDYTQDEKGWVREVNRLTGGKGVDVVYDPVGLINPSLSCIAWNGRVLVVGFAGGSIELVKANRVLLKNVAIVGIHWGMYERMQPDVVQEVWDGIFGLIEEGKFRGAVWNEERLVGLESVKNGLQALEGRLTWGKVVAELPEEEQKSRL